MNLREVYAFHASVGEYKFFGSGIGMYEKRLGREIMPILEEVEKKNGVVLDIGTGNGDFLKEIKEKFPNIGVVGITLARPYDPKVNTIIIANAAENWPLKDNSVDLIFSVFSFCYFGDITKALLEARRVLKEDGEAYIHLGGAEDFRIDGKNLLGFFGSINCIGYNTLLEHIVAGWYRLDVAIKIDKKTLIPILEHIKSEIIGPAQINYLKSTGEFA